MFVQIQILVDKNWTNMSSRRSGNSVMFSPNSALTYFQKSKQKVSNVVAKHSGGVESVEGPPVRLEQLEPLELKPAEGGESVVSGEGDTSDVLGTGDDNACNVDP